MHDHEQDDFSFDIENIIRRFTELRDGSSGQYFEEVELEALLDYYEDRLLYDQALIAADYAIGQHLYAAAFRVRKARLLLALNRENEALAELDTAEALDNSDIELYATRSQVLASMNHYPEALDVLEKAFRVVGSEDHDELWLAMADIYEEMSNAAGLESTLHKALLSNPRNEEALSRLWLHIEMSEAYESGIHFHQKLIDADPYSAMAWYNLGFCYYHSHQPEKAIEAFEFAVLSDPTLPHAYKDCSQVLYEQGYYRRSLECIIDALESVPPDGELYMHAGKAYQALGDSVKAREYFALSVKTDASAAEPYFLLGQCHMSEGKLQNAITAFRKSCRLEPGQANYWFALAEAYAAAEDHEKTFETYMKCIELSPDLVQAWVGLFMYLINLGDYDQASELAGIGFYQSGDVILKYLKAGALLQAGRRRESLTEFTEALALDFDKLDQLDILMPEVFDDHDLNLLIESMRPSR